MLTYGVFLIGRPVRASLTRAKYTRSTGPLSAGMKKTWPFARSVPALARTRAATIATTAAEIGCWFFMCSSSLLHKPSALVDQHGHYCGRRDDPDPARPET